MNKSNFKESISLLNKNIKRHNLLMIIATSVISLVGLLFTLFWEYDPNDITPLIDQLYLIGNILFFAISLALTILLVVSRFVKLKTNALVYVIHAYVFLLLTWGTIVCIMDLDIGISPLFYLMIFTIVSGLFIVEPIFYGVTVALSFTGVLVTAIINRAEFFSGSYQIENIITFIAYLVVIVLTAIEHYRMTLVDFRNEKRLEQLTYFDDLTGLLNERSYLKDIEELDRSGVHKYAVILMDVNNLKATNDAYGHRYGCHLVVRTGHTLPTLFTSSKLYHVGGDEFVAIVLGDDFDNLDEVIKKMEETLTYSIIEFDGQKLIFSVAMGYYKHEKGQKYKDVLQKADKLMYENKEMLKEKYGLKKR